MKRFILGGIVLVLAGCGLEEYESRMIRAQEKVKRYDDLNAVLDDALEMPKHSVTEKQPGGRETTKEMPWDVFLRPPLGIKSKPVGEPREGILYHYSRGTRPGTPAASVTPNTASATGSVPAVGAAARNVTDLYLAFSSDPRETAQFAADVLRLFPTAPSPPPLAVKSIQMPERPQHRVEVLDFDDDLASYAAYFYRPKGAKTTVGVIFRCEKGRRETSRPLLDLSIGTLGVDKDAGVMLTMFGRRVSVGGGAPSGIAAPPPPPPPPGGAPRPPGAAK